MAYKEPMLFGQRKYDVEEAARHLQKAKELEEANTPVYQAALKYLEREHKSIGAVLGRALSRKRK